MILANSITLNSDLMDKLEIESNKTGLKIEELVENCLLNNLDKNKKFYFLMGEKGILLLLL